MGCCSSTGKRRPHSTETSTYDPPMNDVDETVITSIRATDVALGLRRLPAGFYIVLHHNSLEWRTENKLSSVNNDIVEWNEPFPIPSDPSATVSFEVYASFEFRPMLDVGELLRTLTVTVEQLLDYSARVAPFSLLPKDGDVVSPCSSILVTVRRRKCRGSDPSASDDLGPHSSSTESRGELEDATNHGHCALSRFRKHGEKRDLERSVEAFEWALGVCPLDHPCRAVAQSNLAMAKFIHCRAKDTDSSLEVPLGLYRDVLATRPVGHPDRPSTLIQLAAVHLARLEKQRDEDDVAQVESLLHEVLELGSAESHENRAAAFMLQMHARRTVDAVKEVGHSSMDQDSTLHLTYEDLWISSVQLLERFERFGNLIDLQQAIAILKELAKSTSVRGDHKELSNLGAALLYRFHQLGHLSDLEEAISTLRSAVDLIPVGHLDKFTCLNNLGSSFVARFDRLGELSDLDDAISSLRDAVDLTPHGHPDKPTCLNNLGSSLLTRFGRLGQLKDLGDAIFRYRDAVDLTPHGDPDKPARLNNLGNSFFASFGCFGKLTDLENAISRYREAVSLTPHDHPQKPTCLSNLGNAFFTCFKCLGKLSDLEHAISRHRDAVDTTPRGHPDLPIRLNNLGSSLVARFERLGELGDLADTILILKQAVCLTPHGHPNKPTYLNSLGGCLFSRFQRLGELKDLGDAIPLLREAVDLTPHDHPDKPDRLNNLGNSFLARFQRLGQLTDLQDAISRYRDAVDLTPRDHPRKPVCLHNLGTSLFTRFERFAELSDLGDAISTLNDAVDLTAHSHPNKCIRLNNLGNTLLTRFERLGEPSDLEAAISTLKEAVDLTPRGHPNEPTYLNNLGNASLARFWRHREPSDLEDAILKHRDAVKLTPHGHPERSARLNNLGGSFKARFERLGELSDLEDAMSTLREVIDITPHGHPDLPAWLSNLGSSFVTRFERLGELGNIEQAIVLYSHAAFAPIGPIHVRFRASQEWITCARRIRHHSLLHAYSIAIDLLPQLAWIGLSLTQRYSELMRGADVAREAAAAALDSGLSETAVEWLEQGRSIVWGELFQLRSSCEELSCHPEHARRLRELSAALEHAGTTREKVLSTDLDPSAANGATESLRQETDRYRALAIERDKLLQEIRRLPGFERFLLQKEFSEFRISAHSGPIVVLNATESRCDALIVLADVDHVVHVPLPSFPFKRTKGFQNMLEKLLGHARVIRCDSREGGRATQACVSWESLLSTLWNGVVKPVMDALAFSAPENLSRIFWCPTGPFTFLPVHAAGFYDAQHSQPGHKVSDFVVSSYVPTLAILALSLDLSVAHNNDLRLLTVHQPPSDGLCTLPGVATELRHIEEVIKNSPLSCATLVESSAGTVEEVLSLMKEAHWVHFACHGVQDGVDSGLCLADGRRLKLHDMITLSRPRGGFAFLSACQTAMGDESLSDEAIHIAAGMSFAGYGGVVGTMWSISDQVAPEVARDVYEQLFQGCSAVPDHREAARALHGAVGRLRDGGKASFVSWLPFIHVGL